MSSNQREISRIFGRFVDAVSVDESADFDAFCAEHPPLEEALRARYAEWRKVMNELRNTRGPDASEAFDGFLDQLKSRGDVSAKYRNDGEIDRGGMGVVRKVFDLDARRHVALKVLQKKSAPGSSGSAESERLTGRFLEEAQVTGQLSHPGVVPVYEIGVDRTHQLYFTMKLVEGRDLRHIFEQVEYGEEGWNLTRALNVLLRVCETMEYAHSKGVVHRDLKPANIMVGRFGEVYVMDWGLARVLSKDSVSDLDARSPSKKGDVDKDDSLVRSERRDSAESDRHLLTIDGEVIGTPSYMAPEQAAGRLDLVGPQADVYSVGAILYQLLTGEMPYQPEGMVLDPKSVLDMVVAEAPEPLAAIATDIPMELVAICEKAMARRPRRRYSSMSALSEDLRAYLENRVVSAHATGPIEELRKWTVRNRALAATIMTAIVSVLVLAGWALRERSRSEADRAVAQHEKGIAIAARESETAARKQADASAQEAGAARDAAEKAKDRAETALRELRDEIAAREKAEREAALAADKEQRAREEAREADEERRAAEANAETSAGEAIEAEARAASLADEKDSLEERIRRQNALDEEVRRIARHTGLIQELRARAEAFHPVRVETLAEMEEWLIDAEPLRSALASLRARLTDIRGVSNVTLVEEELAEEFAETVALVAGFVEGQGRTSLRGVVELRAQGEELRQEEANLAERTVTGKEARKLWSRVASSLRSDRRFGRNFKLSPQIGFLPIGQDPKSKLWEFAAVRTGEVPERDRKKGLEIAEETAVVLVLVPGGRFWMGASRESTEDAVQSDPWAHERESPVHKVELSPFFLSKYELTQAQWIRLSGENPSYLGLDTPLSYQQGSPTGAFNSAGRVHTLMHPVESVSRKECIEQLGRVGLGLPTEAQWEYACRAGTVTPWNTGAEPKDLGLFANTADLSALTCGFESRAWRGVEDGFGLHAPIGSLLPNKFGLHDMHGNVAEFVRDDLIAYEGSTCRPGDGLRLGVSQGLIPTRGGFFDYEAAAARSAHRGPAYVDWRNPNLGVRPALSIEQ